MPRLVDHDEWRAAALTRVFQLFAQKGYAAVGVREIAQFLGVSTGKLYHYFPNKEALFEQMLRHLGHQDMIRVAESMQGVEPRERATELLRFVEAHRSHFQNILMLMLDYQRHHGSAAEVLQWVVSFYRRAVGAQLGQEDEAAAVPVFSLVLGMLLHQLVDPAGVSPAAHVTLLSSAAPALNPQNARASRASSRGA